MSPGIFSYCIFLVVCIFTALLWSCGATLSCLTDRNDPCLAENYEILEDPTRSAGYFDPESQLKNDYNLIDGWYRHKSPAGTDMPTKAPGPLKCQAIYPMWLNGKS